MTENQTDRFLSWRELTGRIPLHRTTIYTLIRAGTFPAPVQISPGRSVFRESDVERYEANCRPAVTARARQLLTPEAAESRRRARRLLAAGRVPTPAVALNEHAAAKRVGFLVWYLQAARKGRCAGPPFVRLGRAVRYLVADLDAWLAAGRVPTPAVPREQWDRERMPDGTFRVRCSVCGKSVSTPLAEPVIVRAWVMCPECEAQPGILAKIEAWAERERAADRVRTAMSKKTTPPAPADEDPQ